MSSINLIHIQDVPGSLLCPKRHLGGSLGGRGGGHDDGAYELLEAPFLLIGPLFPILHLSFILFTTFFVWLLGTDIEFKPMPIDAARNILFLYHKTF